MRSNGTMTRKECDDLVESTGVRHWVSVRHRINPRNMNFPKVEEDLRWLSIDCVEKNDQHYHDYSVLYYGSVQYWFDRYKSDKTDFDGNPSWFRAPNRCFPAYTNAAIVMLLFFRRFVCSNYKAKTDHARDMIVRSDISELDDTDAFVPEFTSTWIVTSSKCETYINNMSCVSSDSRALADTMRNIKERFKGITLEALRHSLRDSIKLSEIEMHVIPRINTWHSNLTTICENKEPFDYDSWSELCKKTTERMDVDISETRKKDIEQRTNCLEIISDI